MIEFNFNMQINMRSELHFFRIAFLSIPHFSGVATRIDGDASNKLIWVTRTAGLAGPPVQLHVQLQVQPHVLS